MVLRPSEGECKCLVITVILIMSFHDLPHSLAISFQSTIAPPLLGLPFQFRVGLHFPCSDDVPLETRPVRNSEFLRQYDPILSMVGKWRAFSMSDIGLNHIQEAQSVP